jgi:ribonuclease PH
MRAFFLSIPVRVKQGKHHEMISGITGLLVCLALFGWPADSIAAQIVQTIEGVGVSAVWHPVQDPTTTDGNTACRPKWHRHQCGLLRIWRI